MKKYVFGILFLGMIAFLTGCMEDEDEYSLGKFWVGFGIIEETNTDPEEYRITMDNGDVLIPVAADYHHHWYYYHTDSSSRLHDGDRILINYTILGDETDSEGNIEEYYVKVNSVKKVLMKGILEITEENQDSIGNDALVVEDVWQTDSLLNFKIKYWGSYKKHFINLVKQPASDATDAQPVALELRHNANGDAEDFPFAAYVSFKLDELETEGLNSVSFTVTSIDYNGEEHVYEGDYEY